MKRTKANFENFIHEGEICLEILQRHFLKTQALILQEKIVSKTDIESMIQVLLLIHESARNLGLKQICNLTQETLRYLKSIKEHKIHFNIKDCNLLNQVFYTLTFLIQKVEQEGNDELCINRELNALKKRTVTKTMEHKTSAQREDMLKYYFEILSSDLNQSLQYVSKEQENE